MSAVYDVLMNAYNETEDAVHVAEAVAARRAESLRVAQHNFDLVTAQLGQLNTALEELRNVLENEYEVDFGGDLASDDDDDS